MNYNVLKMLMRFKWRMDHVDPSFSRIKWFSPEKKNKVGLGCTIFMKCFEGSLFIFLDVILDEGCFEYDFLFYISVD
jgi:hypothetical protein